MSFPENREFIENLPDSPADWLLVAGDVAEKSADIEWAFGKLSEKFGVVVWSPGNHELWTLRSDPVQLRGEWRYRHLVGLCRRFGILTPEDPYLIWRGAGGPALIAPLFLLYDYSFLPPGAATKPEALAQAYETGIVCTDEVLLHPDPFPTREAWCESRIETTRRRLEATDPRLPTILVSHFPLIREPTEVLKYPVFAQWCGTEQTADWHLRYRALAAVYGHLHIPRTTWHDGVRFEEVSLGYPMELEDHPDRPRRLRQILPAEIPADAPPGGPANAPTDSLTRQA